MQEFNALRAKAKEKRDTTIARAREEYHRAIAQIAALESGLLGSDNTRQQQPVRFVIGSVIPAGRAFTIQDLLDHLRAMDQSRTWTHRAVNKQLTRLRRQGIVRLVQKSRSQVPAVYVSDGQAEERRSRKPLTELVAEMLAGRPMTILELTVALAETGYGINRTKRELRDAVGKVLRTDPMRFKRDGQKWVRICVAHQAALSR